MGFNQWFSDPGGFVCSSRAFISREVLGGRAALARAEMGGRTGRDESPALRGAGPTPARSQGANSAVGIPFPSSVL